MDINERFKNLRKALGLSQEELGNKIGLSKSGVSNIESGTRNVTDKHIKLICSEFPVNEDWLRTGTDEMFLKTPSSTMEQLKKEFGLDEFCYNLVYEYLKLDERKRSTVREFFYNILNGENAVGQQEFKAPDHEPTVEELEAEYKKSISASAQKKAFPASSITESTGNKRSG